MNRLGLASFAPDSTKVLDHSHSWNKDNYPVCTNTYNSLGYRDIEAQAHQPGHTRVLVIGDSFVWGDGIASNDRTLAAVLRRQLDQRSPQQFEVASAAFPGIDLYGYQRFASVLQPVLEPDVVVVSYLPDLALSDAQLIVDAAGPSGLVLRILNGLGVLQDAHTSLHQVSTPWQFTPGAETTRTQLLGRFAELVREDKVRVVFLVWDKTEEQFPEGIEVLHLPQELRYPGHRSELWYAKDHHPKPPLVKKVAALLVDQLSPTAAPMPQPDDDLRMDPPDDHSEK